MRVFTSLLSIARASACFCSAVMPNRSAVGLVAGEWYEALDT
jgi:hypothetical protein